MGWWPRPLILAPKGRSRWIQTSLVYYIASARTARATQGDPVSKNKKKVRLQLYMRYHGSLGVKPQVSGCGLIIEVCKFCFYFFCVCVFFICTLSPWNVTAIVAFCFM